jgi:hypothetical protein
VTGPDDDNDPFRGLILHWQGTDEAWQAWVVYLVGDLAVQAGVPADRLQPAVKNTAKGVDLENSR